MLDTIRAFLLEQLAARADAGEIHRRHAEYYRSLVERADLPLRGAGRHGEWLERLDLESGNLTEALGWYEEHDPGPLPHLYRVLGLVWILRDRHREGRVFVERLMPTADSLPPQARAELLWAELAVADEVGDDAAAQAAAKRLSPLLPQIDDPQLEAQSRLALAWTSPIGGDYDGALRGALDALELLRGQDEPYWTFLAGFTAGGLEIATGRYDEAQRHLDEARRLADQSDYLWAAASSRTALATLAVLEGRLDDGKSLLDEALELSLGAHSIRNLCLLLAGFAELALARGDAERAALLIGAAEGIRRRIGQRSWPMLRGRQHDLRIRIREALGPERFDEVFTAGSRLNQRDAVAAVSSPQAVGTTT